MVAVERVAEPSIGAASQRMLYAGRIGPLYGIFLVKLLLAIPTLGFYNFWAAAKERRYHLANLSLDGDPFEWTGTGGELALGFLKAAGVLLLLTVPGFVLSLMGNEAGPALAQALPFLAIVLLAPAAGYWGLRYRLSRTRWRGIRGGMVGSGLVYALRAHGWSLAMPFTLFQAVPFRSIDLARYRITRMRFGTAPFEFAGSVRAVFGAWLAAWILLAGMLLAVLAAAPALLTGLEGGGLVAVIAPVLMGVWSIDALGGMLAGATIAGVLMALFMANSGGAWDNAKKYIESGAHGGKGSDPHKAAVVGDTVGDPFKDTSGPSLNILVKLMTVVGLVFLPWFV